MFCEKCGNNINPGEKFCEKCGAPIAQEQAPVQQTPVQQTPVQQAPVQQAAPQPQQYAQPQQFDPSQQYTAAPKPPKKPLSKGAKKAILFSAIGAVAVAAILVVLFVVILPMVNRIDPSNYLTMEFYDETVYDGAISGKIRLDVDKLVADKGWTDNDYMKQSAAEGIFDSLELSYVKKGDTSVKDSGSYYLYFDKASKDDVYAVTVTWPTDESELAMIKMAEEYCGLGFDKSTKTVELKVGDLVAEKKVEVKEPLKIDALTYIKDNDLIISEGSGNSVSVYVDVFEETAGDYTMKRYSKYDSYISVYDKSNDYVGDFYIQFDKDRSLKDGDKVTLSYNDDRNSGDSYAMFNLTGDPITYTVIAPRNVEENDVKDHAEDIKTNVVENISDYDYSYDDGDSVEVKQLYYITRKDDSSFTPKVVALIYNSTQKYYKTLEFYTSDMYMLEDKFVIKEDIYASDNGSEKKQADAVDSCWYLSKNYGKFYNATELL